ncbi:replicative DNA helicase [Kitasatospora sp. NPDC001664]
MSEETDLSAFGEVPHDLAAEKKLLGAMMLSKDAVTDVVEILDPVSFYRPAHEFIYAAVLALYAQGEPVDPVTVSAHLAKQDLLTRVGGEDYVHSLHHKVRTTTAAEALASRVEDLAMRRRLIEVSVRIDRLARTDEPISGLVDAVQAETLAVTTGRARSSADANLVSDIMEGALDVIEGFGSHYGTPSGISTGLVDLDALTNGLHPGQLVVIASRPSLGKSTLALHLLRACAIQQGLPAVLFSLQMGRNEFAMRLLAAETRVPLHQMRSGNLTGRDWTRVAGRMPNVTSSPMYIDDAPNLTLDEIRSKSRRLVTRNGVKLIVLDHVQLLDQGRHKYGTRYEDINQASRRLKLLARELEVPIVVLSQLNRGPEQRDDKRPQIYDLRDSGTLEDDADLVVLLHRDDAYNKKSNRPGEADLIVAKHSTGPCATITVAFNATLPAFAEMRHDGTVPQQPAPDHAEHLADPAP